MFFITVKMNSRRKHAINPNPENRVGVEECNVQIVSVVLKQIGILSARDIHFLVTAFLICELGFVSPSINHVAKGSATFQQDNGVVYLVFHAENVGIGVAIASPSLITRTVVVK